MTICHLKKLMKIRKFEFDLKDENCYRIYWSLDKMCIL